MEGDFCLLPSGIIIQWNNSGSQWSLNVTAFIGIDVVIHLAGLCEEAEKYVQKGLGLGKGLEGWIRLPMPDRAHIALDCHQTADGIQEQQRGEQAGKNLGTTKRAFSLFVLPKSPRICHLISDFDGFSERFQVLANHYKSIYPTSEIDIEDEFQTLEGYLERVKPTARYMEFISYIELSKKDHQRKSG